MSSIQKQVKPALLRRQGSAPVLDLNYPCDPSWLGPATFELVDGLEGLPPAHLAFELRQRISAAQRVPIDNVHLFDSIDQVLLDLLHRATSPTICFPPSASATLVQRIAKGTEVVSLVRGFGHESAIDLDSAADLPADGIVFIDSPSDPLGSVLLPIDAVRLARACQLVIVDERYGEFSNFSLRGLASEFHNIVVLRSYERWLGHNQVTCGWAISGPETVARFGMTSGYIDPSALASAIALLCDRKTSDLTARLARQERSRLYRLLRKFSFLTPLPSWGPFMSARVNVVPRSTVVRAFLARGVRVHAPEEAGLEDFIRISIGSRTAMERFRVALVDMGPELLA